MLSVAAVASGMSLSTPESNPMTGILASLNFWSSGIAALLSSAAKQSACGFLLSAAWTISSCLSTCDSFSGPSKVMVTLNCVAAFSAPCFTACQNWCWKPFEIIGMKDLAAEPPVVAVVPPHAAATRTTAARPPSQRVDLPLMFLSIDVCFTRANAPSPTAAPPRHDRGDAVLLTGFGQGERISVSGECYRLAPWVKDARSLARL